jgi:hypothetical protein
VAVPAGHVDILPTLANLAGAQPDGAMLGRSLVDVLAGENADLDRPVFQEVKFDHLANPHTTRFGMVTRRWHVLYQGKPNKSWQVYDLAEDPGETRDLAGSGAAREEREQLLEWIDGLQYPPGAAALLQAALLEARPEPETAVDARFGPIRLLGADVSGPARAGEEVTITYYFEAGGRLDGDWKLFVHIGDGARRFQDDHVPVHGVLPFARMGKGQLVADRRTIRVPAGKPAGEYPIHVGLWSPSKKQNHDGKGKDVLEGKRVRVGTLVVRP